ncbi:MAG: hypothetical protein ACFBSC_15010 [Microcoleaceae cyanobacterium]
MLRQDLLALTTDDLIVLSNRGLVKRATKELETGQLSYELVVDSAGTVTVQWSDEIECILPADSTLGESRCSCPATTICRHLIRSVLAYQLDYPATDNQITADPQAATPESTTDPGHEPEATPEDIPVTPLSSWNPGEISDEDLTRFYSKTELSRLRKIFEAGQVMELIKSSKPVARFHSLPYTVRFLVPQDIRYTYCNCSEAAPCSHVPLAVWGFRWLSPDQTNGIVETRSTSLEVPTTLLDDLETTLVQSVQAGFANLDATLVGRWKRLESQCRAEGLVWPAEIILELMTERDRYLNHDARFSPARISELVGELCIRLDAIHSNPPTIPRLFIQGSSTDCTTNIGSGRLIGLGCGVQLGRRNFRFSAYLQDVDSGMVVALCRDYPIQAESDDPANQPLQSFAQIAQTPIKKGISWSALGAGQLLIQGAKLTPSRELTLNRAKATLNPQALHWEQLRSPLLVEDFSELQAHLQALPPACLQPRRLTDHFYVCPVTEVRQVEFDPTEQAVVAHLQDAQGKSLRLVHPYTSQGKAGVEQLLIKLQSPTQQLKFVAGQVFLKAEGLVVSPISLAFEQNSSESLSSPTNPSKSTKTRTLLQPWIAKASSKSDNSKSNLLNSNELIETEQESHPITSPLTTFLTIGLNTFAELLITGLSRSSELDLQACRELKQLAEQLGFYRLTPGIHQLIEQLENKGHNLQWQSDMAAQKILELIVWIHLAQIKG